MEMEQWKQPSVPSFQRLEDTEAVPDVHSVDVGLPNVSVKLEKEEDDLWESNHQCSEENKAFPDAHSGLPVATMKMDEPWEPKALEEIENIVDQCSEFLEGMTDVKGEEESWIHQAVEENNTFPSTCSGFPGVIIKVEPEEEPSVSDFHAEETETVLDIQSAILGVGGEKVAL
uniref:Uncharacterized protein n=1 Tax=Sphaerodactylus townsendi TaxID=933632 RepID=A0ACB8EFP7_9SAUR